ncbi:histidine kinase [Flavobacterium sp. MFBS3-15]|uniref:sensor histidine kinase n=1 Tax=Flavobacterium sp. MFBS3-15 TaxID=2989816 RepID=UPI002235793C|nr:histidine kinase [Flavobacterium sp. MFBS3-15]MCW4467621.1 histidine kinase [Flavobacterium sp. MFBS3-15]
MKQNSPYINENWVFQFLTASRYRVYRQLLLVAVISLVLYNSGPEVKEPTLTLVLFLLLFYTNIYLLVPRLLFKNKYTLYCLSVLAVLLLSVKIYLFGCYLFGLDSNIDGLNIPLFYTLILVIIAASSSMQVFQKWIVDKQLIHELEKSKSSAELEQLKNQINPHFLFNMLNNANVLTKEDPEKASQVLVKLSDLLRYQLYDSARDKVLLTSDIHFLEDFLNLEKVRRDNFDFMISKEGNLSGVQVPPLLFISFVENAVKHNNDSAKSSYVNLFFKVRDNEVFFKCVNSKPVLKAVSKSGGLGLANIRRRLELLFPSAHLLHIEDNPETYSVSLTLKL